VDVMVQFSAIEKVANIKVKKKKSKAIPLTG
jgi:hypothetical protein